MVSSLRNWGLHLSENEYSYLKTHKEIVESGNRWTFCTPSDKEEHGKHVIVDVLEQDKNEGPGCYDHKQ